MGVHGQFRPRREQKSPRLLRKMRALLFRRACCSRRGMFRRRFSAEAPPGLAPSRFPLLRFRRAPGSEKPPVFPFAALFCARRSFHGGRLRGTPFRRISCRAFPQQSRCRTSLPPPPVPAPGRHRAPASRPCRACAEHTPFFAKNAFDFHRLRPSQHALPLSGIIPDKKERRPDIPPLQQGGITA